MTFIAVPSFMCLISEVHKHPLFLDVVYIYIYPLLSHVVHFV